MLSSSASQPHANHGRSRSWDKFQHDEEHSTPAMNVEGQHPCDSFNHPNLNNDGAFAAEDDGISPIGNHQNPIGWSKKNIWQWYDKLPWLVGMNYLPRTAVNFVEMWDESSFDPEVIEQELHWAAHKLGYNTLRTNIPFVLYEHDPAGLKRRMNKFLHIAEQNGFVVMLCPLDDCEFSGESAKAGPQPEPVPGLHNSRAVGSPGRQVVMDQSQWYRVEEYVRWTVHNWGNDKRIFLLDLYNEPGNPWIFTKEKTYLIPDAEFFEKQAFILMEKVFQWARDEKPSCPLSISAWHMPDPFSDFNDTAMIPLSHEIDQRAMALSDVITVHAYCDPVCLRNTLNSIDSLGKPILLTEWMARQVKSTYETALPILKELNVGAYQWGLVKGKSQTYLPWPHVANKFIGDPMWWHDVLDGDGNLHSEQEGEIIRSFVYSERKALAQEVALLESKEYVNHSGNFSEGGEGYDVSTEPLSSCPTSYSMSVATN